MTEFVDFNLREQEIRKALESRGASTIPELYEIPAIRNVTDAQWRVRDMLLSLHGRGVVRKLPPISGRSHLWELVTKKPEPVVKANPEVRYTTQPIEKPTMAIKVTVRIKNKGVKVDASFNSASELAEFIGLLQREV